MCYLPDFKKNVWNEKAIISLDTCRYARNINLYCICDSYLYSFIKSESVFCGVRDYKFTRWGLDVPIEVELDTFAVGGHGFGMRKRGIPVDNWPELLRNWLNKQKLIKAP